MTKQAELKKQAYESSLKSRALSVLIYLIDRSNKDLTCFPAIPTMAQQLHISISTVKRALGELVEAGFIEKMARFRDKNKGQTSNLYTLVLFETVPKTDQDNDLDDKKNKDIAVSVTEQENEEVEHICFDVLKEQKNGEEQGEFIKKVNEQNQRSCQKVPVRQLISCTPVQTLAVNSIFSRSRIQAIKGQGQVPSGNSYHNLWTGVGVSFIPP